MIPGWLAQTYTTTTTSTRLNSGVLVASLLFGLVLAIIPAMVASRKGYSAIGFYLFGLLCFLPALIVSLVISDKRAGSSHSYYGSTLPGGGAPYAQQPWAPVPPPPPAGPPPGWYPDPGGSAQQRYWDGTKWTEHLT